MAKRVALGALIIVIGDLEMNKRNKTYIRLIYLIVLLFNSILFSCTSNISINNYIQNEPIIRNLVIKDYQTFYDINHWVVLQDSMNQIYYISQPGSYTDWSFVSQPGPYPYALKSIRGKKLLLIGDSIRVKLYKYISYPDNFHMAERSDCSISLGSNYIIRTERGWVDNIYYCPEIEFINDIMYIKEPKCTKE